MNSIIIRRFSRLLWFLGFYSCSLLSINLGIMGLRWALNFFNGVG